MGSRAIWKGTITFGLVNVPVSLHTAVQTHDLSFRQVTADGTRIKQKRVRADNGEEVAYEAVVKGYEHQDGTITVLTADDMAALPLSTLKAIEVMTFVDAGTVNPMLREASYYVEAEPKTGKTAYALLVAAMASTGKAAVAKVALRQRESLALLREDHGVIILDLLHWADEVREAPKPADTDVNPDMLVMAEALVLSMAGDFDPGSYHDNYTDALLTVVTAKSEGKTLTAAEASEPAAETDLAAMLTASLAAKAGA